MKKGPLSIPKENASEEVAANLEEAAEELAADAEGMAANLENFSGAAVAPAESSTPKRSPKRSPKKCGTPDCTMPDFHLGPHTLEEREVEERLKKVEETLKLQSREVGTQ